MSILKIDNLSHRYSTSWAIRDINLEIKQTGVIGLLGSNGAGKSTTMNIICGALNPTIGKVYIDGVDSRKEPLLAKQKIGFLPQTPPLHLDFTVDEYLTYAAELRGVQKSEIPAALEEAKEKCQITHFSSRLLKNLSGGYRQRVGIAQAIIHKPQLVVMDEPTNGLDPNQLIEARKLIKEIGKDRTVLLSSHIMSEIHLLCRDIVMIESGRIIFSDSMEAFNNYLEASSLKVVFKSPPTESQLATIPGVNQVEALNSQEFRIRFDGNQEISEHIIEASVANGWRLKEIVFEKQILDDVFKQLSSQAHN
jgi:ABC-2 type transport system ATP-binding protein